MFHKFHPKNETSSTIFCRPAVLFPCGSDSDVAAAFIGLQGRLSSLRAKRLKQGDSLGIYSKAYTKACLTLRYPSSNPPSSLSLNPMKNLLSS
jgi:hypothetical protein